MFNKLKNIMSKDPKESIMISHLGENATKDIEIIKRNQIAIWMKSMITEMKNSMRDLTPDLSRKNQKT